MNPVPDPITSNTGEHERASGVIDDFFLETRDFVLKTYRARESEFQIRSGAIAYDPFHVSDDRVTYLSFRDTIIAGVFAVRTEFNYVNYIFFRNLECARYAYEKARQK